jgi:hypothetical protein
MNWDLGPQNSRKPVTNMRVDRKTAHSWQQVRRRRRKPTVASCTERGISFPSPEKPAVDITGGDLSSLPCSQLANCAMRRGRAC